jgi:hypothetical protein
VRFGLLLICLLTFHFTSAQQGGEAGPGPEHPELEGAEAAEPVVPEALTALEEAERCVQKGEIEEAIRLFQDFGKKWPVHPRAPYVAARIAELQAQLAFRERESAFLKRIAELAGKPTFEQEAKDDRLGNLSHGVGERGGVGVRELGSGDRLGNLVIPEISA